jgi:hypothetical protein
MVAADEILAIVHGSEGRRKGYFGPVGAEDLFHPAGRGLKGVCTIKEIILAAYDRLQKARFGLRTPFWATPTGFPGSGHFLCGLNNSTCADRGPARHGQTSFAL